MSLDLDNIYTYHVTKGDQIDRYEIILHQAKELAIKIQSLCPESRERSVALTHLETALMWANQSIARNE